MRIAFVAFSPQFVQYVTKLLEGLISRGHEIRIFTTHKLPEKAPDHYLKSYFVSYEKWSWFETHTLEVYKPDLVILWNGYAPWTYAAMKWIKSNYPTLHVERGWLPQKEHCYIADDLAPHSEFIMNMPANFQVDRKRLDDLVLKYKPRFTDSQLPERFIFVPAQLDEDTSITISSPIYKNCDSLIGNLIKHFPKHPIIVKNHPLAKDKMRSEKITLYDGPLSSLDLCAQASVVVGISSTVLIEALIYNKPVVSFGYNVAMMGHISAIRDGETKAWDAIELAMISQYGAFGASEKTLSWLLSKQWTMSSPESWVYEYIESKGGPN